MHVEMLSGVSWKQAYSLGIMICLDNINLYLTITVYYTNMEIKMASNPKYLKLCAGLKAI